MIDWAEWEPDARDALQQVGRLLARGFRRPRSVIAIALLVGSAVAALQRQRPAAARVVLRVVEGDLDPGTAPRPTRDLREHIARVVFSRGRLKALIRARGLYPGKDDDRAIEAMRDDLEVDVWRNDFLGARAPDDPPASARVAISFRASDPLLADAVARDLAQLVVEQEQADRLGDAERTADQAARELAQARSWLREALPSQEQELAERRRHKAALDLRAAFERRRLGLHFQIVDAGRPHSGFVFEHRALIIDLAAFALLLPIAALLLGAFDEREASRRG